MHRLRWQGTRGGGNEVELRRRVVSAPRREWTRLIGCAMVRVMGPGTPRLKFQTSEAPRCLGNFMGNRDSRIRRRVTPEGVMRDQEIRAALDRHWAASDANDFETEHDIYAEDAVLEYPQSGERIRGRRNIQITRTKKPSRKRFTVRRVIGSGDLWITEYILT